MQKENQVPNWAKLILVNYTVLLSRQQKLPFHDGQNAKVLLITTMQIRVRKSF